MNNSGIGKLIVIEGGDGLGKSTQYRLIKDMLTRREIGRASCRERV